jgi:L-threonylcarbamoyladenylate synthase
LGKRRKNSPSTGKIVRIDPSAPDDGLFRDAALVLKSKDVLVFPTSGLYGMGVDAFCPEAIRKVYSIKQRAVDQPLLVLVADGYDLNRLVRSIPEYTTPLFVLWPGDITLIFEAVKEVPKEITGGTDKIGVRRPAHPVARGVVEAFGGPITGTSANLSGSPAAFDIGHLAPEIRREAGMVLDAGPLPGGVGSTILDVSVWPVKMIREGRVPFESIRDLLKY